MKKLAVVYPAHYREFCGGAELQISYLCHAALQTAWEVHYIYIPRRSSLQPAGTEILHPLQPCGEKAPFYRYRKQIAEILEQIRPDVVYTRHSSSWIEFAGEYAARHGISHFHALASDRVAEMRNRLRDLLTSARWWEKKLLRRGMRRVRYFITQNEFQQQQILRIFGIQGHLISQMAPRCANETIVKAADPVEVYWIANLKGLKRPEIFIDLVRQLAQNPPQRPCRFYMCGRMSEKYRTMVSVAEKEIPSFQYLGELPQEEVNARLCRAHLLVNTSIYEGFSNTFVQAWMRRVPVLSMNSDPDATLSRHGLGMLTPDKESLVRALRMLVEAPEQREKLGLRACEYAVRHHSLEKNMPQLLALLEAAVKK